MKIKLLFTIFLVFSSLSYSQVVINEIDADNPGANDFQFIELKTPLPNSSLDGYVLVFFNGTTGTGTASYLSIDLDGKTTDINGNFLAGNVSVTPSPSLLINNAAIQIGPDVVALYSGNATDFPVGTLATATNLIDAVAYSNATTTSPSSLMGILGISTCYVDVQPMGSISKSIQRLSNGTYAVNPPTPKANNDGSGTPINYITTSFNSSSYTEGQNAIITFTTSSPVTSNTTFTIALENGNFNSSDFTFDTNNQVTINSGSNTATKTITLIDDVLEEGDEEFILVVSGLPTDVELNNNSIVRRVADTDFQVANFGTPLAPTYGQVSSTAPAGYYASLEGLSGAALKQALQDIIANPSVVHLHSYADIWDIIRVADTNPLNSGQIWDMYLEVPMSKIDQQQGSSIVGKWNREHIFCQSRGGFVVADGDYAEGINVWNTTSAASTVDGVSDAHHIRAENGQENSSRNNKNYGPVNSSTVYAGPVGTQGSWHGDVARSLFYMAVRFNGLNVVNGDPSETTGANPSGNIGDLATLLSWNVSDKRDDYEMNRNNYVYTWQNNRNPFIDYPLLADYIFGANYGQPWFAALASESFDAAEIKVFPNPASEHIFVSGLTGTSNVQIFSISGAKVLETTINTDQMLPINFESGMYFVKVSNEEKQIVKKIIVK
ncbi:endonuclease [Flavobacterium urocaniciphilum]|uniref:Por secretion system C-terminal sorting domain-containing protein n=1 Tax=Flavobacterium urocaniciphilum TaxID=1299341 RepID=A0A1H8ZN35_9FLAO|nr:endonuclease [Flavobacterium urocaniciphilum]SEP65643.1 Por secretion system C-terminal sorting domain-containing protein [Flavobacterium urocaniciphilum]